jgi:hypothetical protein
MDKTDSDLVNLHHPQVDQSDVTCVHLRSEQEDSKMLQPEVVDRIRELSGQGLGSKRIARQLGVFYDPPKSSVAHGKILCSNSCSARRERRSSWTGDPSRRLR